VTLENPLGDAVLLLHEYCQRSPSEDERRLLEIAGGAAAFLSFTGQLYRFEDFRKNGTPAHVRTLSLARVTRALEHMRTQASSADERETLRAAMDALDFIDSSEQHEALENYLRYWHRGALPPVLAVFETHEEAEEAEAWLESIPEPAKHAFITINGEHYLAACWQNVNHRALYPFTLAGELAKERRARMQRLGLSEGDEREE